MKPFLIILLLSLIFCSVTLGDIKQDKELLIHNGTDLVEQGKFDEAASAFAIVTRIDPKDADIWAKMGFALLCAGHYADAVDAYDSALQITPDDPFILANKGLALNALDQYEEALQMFTLSLQIEPDNIPALNNKGIILMSMGRGEEALVLFDHALQIDPDSTDSLNHKGLALNSIGRVSEALTAYNAVTQRDPSYIEAWNNKGLSLLTLGRYEEANAMFDMATKLDPADPIYWNNKGTAEFKAGKITSALQAYGMSLSIHTNPHHAGSAFAKDLGEDSRKQQISNDILNLSLFDATSAESWNNIGSLFLSHSDYPEANASYMRAIQIDPSSVDAKNYFSRISGSSGFMEKMTPVTLSSVEELGLANSEEDGLNISSGRDATLEQNVTGTVKYLVEQQGWKITLPGTITGLISPETGKIEITSTDAFISYGGTTYPITMNVEGIIH